MHKYNCFLTLTYDDDNLPADRNLCHRHYQLLLKKLRERINRQHEKLRSGTYTEGTESKALLINPQIQESTPPLKYHMCGEYGPRTGRPHYHANMFGIDFADKKKYKKSEAGEQMYTSALLDEIWGLGQCTIGKLNWQTAAYTARYNLKKAGDKNKKEIEILDIETGEIIKRTPEYHEMSRNPGLGSTWFDKYKNDVYPHGTVIVNAKENAPPRYYDEKYKKLDPEGYEKLKSHRRAEHSKRDDSDLTGDRNRSKEAVKRAQLHFLKRNGQ